MEKTFYGVKLVVKTGSIETEPADVYITDDPLITGSNVINVDLGKPSGQTHGIFGNIFRKTLDALLSLNKVGYYRTVAIGKFTNNTDDLSDYQVIRATLYGMLGFCQLTGKANPGKNNIRKIFLVIPPEALSAVQELERSENFKNLTDISVKKPTMLKILQREYCVR